MRIADRFLIKEPEAIPRGWGLAYWLPDVRDGVYLPIPLNVVVRGLRELWSIFIRGVFPSYIDNKCMKSWMAGYAEAMNFHWAQGYTAGERVGAKAAVDRMNKVFDDFLEELQREK